MQIRPIRLLLLVIVLTFMALDGLRGMAASAGPAASLSSDTLSNPQAPAPAPAAAFGRLGALVLNPGEGDVTAAVVDAANGFAYFGTNSRPSVVVKVRLLDFTRVATLTLNAPEDYIHTGVIDPANGYAYFGNSSGVLIKVSLLDFTRVATLTLNAGEIGSGSAVIDTANGFAYFGTPFSPGIVVKIRLSDFTRVGALTLNAGEYNLDSAVIDTANGFAYFGTSTSPGRVVKVRLSDLTRVGALTLNTGEDYVRAAVIDPANGFAYFGTNTSQSIVVKVRLADFSRVGALFLNLDEENLRAAVIDTSTSVNPIAYFGTDSNPGKVVKVRLYDLTRVGAVTFNSGERDLKSAVIDTANQYAYFGTGTDPGVVVKVQLSGESLPDLAVTMNDTPDPVNAGEALTYDLTVQNSGPVIATGVTLSDTLPANVNVRVLNPSQGSCEGTNVIVCALGTLIPGSKATVNIVVTPMQEGTLNNSVIVKALQPELNTANNTATQATTVAPALPPRSNLYLPSVFRDWDGTMPPPPPPVTPPAAITLTASATSIVPTGTLGLQWQIGGDTSGLNLVIRAREPGNIYTSTLETTYQPGTLPPTGRILYLKPDRTWIITPTAYLAPAATGNVTLNLPSQVEGEWSLEALLRNPPTNNFISGDARPLLSAAVPRIDLRRSRPIANTTDRVTIELLTAAGAAPRNVMIAATLTLNDGSPVALPSLTLDSPLLYTGPSQNARYTLFDGDLSYYGEGNYLVKASLVLSETGEVLGVAAAGFQVCNTPSTLMGVVYGSNGQPLGGGNPSLALVSALDLDDGATTATAAIANNGSYSTPLEPGRYLIAADVEDAAGHHSANAPSVLVVGCEARTLTLNLTAGPPTGQSSAKVNDTAKVSRPTAPLAPSANASDGLPKPGALIAAHTKDLQPGDFPPNVTVETLTRDFKGWITTAAGGQVEFLTSDDVRRLGIVAVDQLLTGNNADLEQLSQAVGKEFLLDLEFGRDALGTYVRGTVIDTKSSGIVPGRRHDERGNPIRGGMVLQTASRLGIGLFADLRSLQERPIVPKLSLDLNTTTVQQGSAFNATVTLKDGNGQLMANKPVSILHWPVGRPTILDPDVFNGQTDTNGKFAYQLLAGNTVGPGWVDGRYSRLNVQWCVNDRACKGSKLYRVVGPADLFLSAPVNELHAFQSTQVCANLQRGGNPVSGATINLSALGGYGFPSSVTTGSDGRACFIFTANGSGFVAWVYARYNDTQSGTTLSADLPFHVIGSVDAILSAFPTTVLNDNTSNLSMRVTVGGQAVPALPVQLDVSSGALNTNITQTDNQGNVAVTYLAPSTGAGTAYITATASYADLIVTRTTAIDFRPVACQAPTGARCYDTRVITQINPYNGIVPLRLTDSGKVLGWTIIGSASHFMYWQNGTLTDGGALSAPSGLQNPVNIFDVNESGNAVGQTVISNCTGLYCAVAVRWLGGAAACPAYEGKPADCTTNTLVIELGSLLSMNSSGDAVFHHLVNPFYGSVAYLWKSGSAYVTDPIGYTTAYTGFSRILACCVNASQKVALVPTTGGSDLYLNCKAARWAMSNSGGQLTSLGTLGGQCSRPTFIADSGAIVGTSDTSGGARHAFYAPSNSMSDLGTLGGKNSTATGVNSSGQVVGNAETTNGETHAFVYTGGQMRDLNKLIDFIPNAVLYNAIAINTSGQILVDGGGPYYLLTPR